MGGIRTTLRLHWNMEIYMERGSADFESRRGVSRSDQAYRFIIDGIRAGRLVPGTRLREIELAAQIGLSRTPVRGALQRLQQEGYIVDSPSMR